MFFGLYPYSLLHKQQYAHSSNSLPCLLQTMCMCMHVAICNAFEWVYLASALGPLKLNVPRAPNVLRPVSQGYVCP